MSLGITFAAIAVGLVFVALIWPFDRANWVLLAILLVLLIATLWLWTLHLRGKGGEPVAMPPPKPPPPTERSPAFVPRGPRTPPSLSAHASPTVEEP